MSADYQWDGAGRWSHVPARCLGPAVAPAVRAVVRLAAVLCLLGSIPGPAAAQFSDQQVKAAFVASFLKFVTWPEAQAPRPGQPFVMAVIGDDALTRALVRAVEGQSVGGRAITVRMVHRLRELPELPHLLFIGSSQRENLSALLRDLEGHAVLTVGDSTGFGASGVLLNFYESDKRIRFEANTTAAARAGLRVSSHLLSIARIVG